MEDKIANLSREEAMTSIPKPNFDETSNYLTAKDLAEKLKISRSMIYKLVKNGQLECVHLGRLVRFPPDSPERLAKGPSRTAP